MVAEIDKQTAKSDVNKVTFVNENLNKSYIYAGSLDKTITNDLLTEIATALGLTGSMRFRGPASPGSFGTAIISLQIGQSFAMQNIKPGDKLEYFRPIRAD